MATPVSDEEPEAEDIVIVEVEREPGMVIMLVTKEVIVEWLVVGPPLERGEEDVEPIP